MRGLVTDKTDSDSFTLALFAEILEREKRQRDAESDESKSPAMKRKRLSDSTDLDETVNRETNNRAETDPTVAGDEEDNVLTQFYAQRDKINKSWQESLTGL